jgi:hypothetical protein
MSELIYGEIIVNSGIGSHKHVFIWIQPQESNPALEQHGQYHRVHRVAPPAFWRTFSHEGKISPGWWGWGVHAHALSLHLPSPVKLQCTLQLSGRPQTTYLYKRWNRVSVSAYSAGAYTATLLVMVNVMKGGGRAPPSSPAWPNFTLMTECTPESRRYYSVYSVWQTH